MVYWLASPADEEVWRVMDQWNEVGRMVIAPFFDGQACLISRDFGLVPQAKALRSSWTKQGQKVNDLFLRSASELILSGRLRLWQPAMSLPFRDFSASSRAS